MCPPNSSLSQNRCKLLNRSCPVGGFSIHACRMRDHCNTPFPVLTRELPPKRRAWESEHYRMKYLRCGSCSNGATLRQERLYSETLLVSVSFFLGGNFQSFLSQSAR